MEFKTWRDSYLFLKEYGSFTCLQCRGSHHNLDLNTEHTDLEYGRFFCSKTVSMVRLDFQFTCHYWEDENGETIQGHEDDCIFNIPSDLIDKLEVKGKKWTFEEVKELIGDYKDE